MPESKYEYQMTVEELLSEWETDGDLGERYAGEMRAAIKFDSDKS